MAELDTLTFVELATREGDDVLDFLKSKGVILEGFKREFLELQSNLEGLGDSLLDKDRENEGRITEILLIQDQTSVSKKNVEDNIASAKALQNNLDQLRMNKTKLMDREFSNRLLIQSYAPKFAAVQEALDVGTGWTAAQEDEKMNLEKERDFMSKKLDSRNTVVSTIRSDVDKLYELIQLSETGLVTKTNDIDAIKNSISILTKVCDQTVSKSNDTEKRIKLLQQQIIQADADVLDRKFLLHGDSKTLQALERSLQGSRDQMD